jgi:hypothetical protein
MHGGHNAESATVVMARESLTAAGIVVVAAFAAVVLFPAGPMAGRAAVMAVAVGCATRYVADWRVCTAVTALSMLVLVAALADGMPTTEHQPWSYTPVIVLAAVLGSDYRRMINHPNGSGHAFSNDGPGPDH